MKKYSAFLASAIAALFSTAGVCGTLKVYGPAGPAPAYKAAVTAFEKQTGETVDFQSGLVSSWIAKAKSDGDLIYSGSESMMSDILANLESNNEHTLVEPLYVRPLVLVVRKGNPKAIHGFDDLLKPGVKIEVVNGSGLTGAWEDILGREGDISKIKAFRANIASFASSSGEAKQIWKRDSSIDAWLTWNTWQISVDEAGDLIPLEERYSLYRDTGVALTSRGSANPIAGKFLEFLKSASGRAIFKAQGWVTEDSK